MTSIPQRYRLYGLAFLVLFLATMPVSIYSLVYLWDSVETFTGLAHENLTMLVVSILTAAASIAFLLVARYFFKEARVIPEREARRRRLLKKWASTQLQGTSTK